MWIDPRDKRNTASNWPQGLANGHLFTYCLVEESKGDKLTKRSTSCARPYDEPNASKLTGRVALTEEIPIAS